MFKNRADDVTVSGWIVQSASIVIRTEGSRISIVFGPFELSANADKYYEQWQEFCDEEVGGKNTNYEGLRKLDLELKYEVCPRYGKSWPNY